MREIKESDWKIFQQLHRVVLDRFCERILSEVEQVSGDGTKSFHDRYLDVYKLLHRRDKEVAEVFNDLRRSTAFYQLAAMKGRGMLTEEEFSRFSEETRNLVGVLLGE